MCGSIVDIQSSTADNRRGIKKGRKKKPQDKNIMSASATQGGHKQVAVHLTVQRSSVSITLVLLTVTVNGYIYVDAQMVIRSINARQTYMTIHIIIDM